MLQQYRAALDKSQEVQADYDAHVQYLQSPEMQQKERELKEQTSQLQDIEQELGELSHALNSVCVCLFLSVHLSLCVCLSVSVGRSILGREGGSGGGVSWGPT